MTLSPASYVPWQRMVKNLEKELALLKQELAIHDSLVRDGIWGRGKAAGGRDQGQTALWVKGGGL